jgi:hypothetical protein
MYCGDQRPNEELREQYRYLICWVFMHVHVCIHVCVNHVFSSPATSTVSQVYIKGEKRKAQAEPRKPAFLLQISSYTNVVLLVLHLKFSKFNSLHALAWSSCPESHRFVSYWRQNCFILVTLNMLENIIIIIIIFPFGDGLIA